MDQRHNARAEWASVPTAIRGAVDQRLGSHLVRFSNVAGGFSPGPAGAAELADGRRVFVKACGTELNTFTPDMHRREASVLRQMPAELPVPALIDVVTTGTGLR